MKILLVKLYVLNYRLYVPDCIMKVQPSTTTQAVTPKPVSPTK